MDISKLDNYITNFLAYLREKKHRNLATIKNYTLYLSRFSKWARNNGLREPEMITSTAVKEYKYWLNGLKNRSGNSLSKNTKNYHLTALRSFLRYLERAKLSTIEFKNILLEKVSRNIYKPLQNAVLDKLLNAPFNTLSNKKTDSIIATRDKAVLEMLVATGITVSETAKLKKGDVIEDERGYIVNICEEKNKRSILLSNQAAHWIKKYLSLRNDSSPFLFISHDKAKNKRNDYLEPLTSRTVQRIVKKYGRLIDALEDISPRTLRKAFALRITKRERDLYAAQKILGHKSIGATKKLCWDCR